MDFPGGTVDKNPPTDSGDMGSTPSPGRFHMLQGNYAHVPQLLSQRSTGCMLLTTEPACHSY